MDMRKIEPAMTTYLLKRLEGNGLAQEAIHARDARTVFRLAAQACVGIREVGGNNRGPMVTLMQETIGGPDPWPWCMSFVQTCLAFAEAVTGKYSPIYPHEHVVTVWSKTPKVQRVKVHPLAGAIAVWRHGKTLSGHTGIVESCDETIFDAYEGNTTYTAPGDPVVRDGGGVARTVRSRKGDGTMVLVGFLKPF